MNPDVCYEHTTTCEDPHCLCSVTLKEDCEQCQKESKENICKREVRPIPDKGYWESYWVHIKDCKGDHE